MSSADRITRVLVLDATPEVRTRLCALIGEAASVAVVGSTSDAQEAMRQSAALRPHAVVMDVPANDAEGLIVLNSLRRTDPRCLLIVLTNCVSVEFWRACVAAGADHVLAKSQEFERAAELVHALREWL